MDDQTQAALIAAFASVCESLNWLICEDNPVPDSFIVFTPVSDDPDYAGDTDVGDFLQVRATWYDRNGTAGHASALKAAFRSAGYTVAGTTYGFDNDTKHYATYVEGVIYA